MSRVRSAQLVDGVAIGATHAAAWEQAYGHIFDAGSLRRAAEGRRTGWSHTIEGCCETTTCCWSVSSRGGWWRFARTGPAPDQPRVAENYGFCGHAVAWGSGLASELLAETCSRLATRWDRVILWTLRESGRPSLLRKVRLRTGGGQWVETLGEWTTDTSAEAPAVEYAKSLRSGRSCRGRVGHPPSGT